MSGPSDSGRPDMRPDEPGARLQGWGARMGGVELCVRQRHDGVCLWRADPAWCDLIPEGPCGFAPSMRSAKRQARLAGLLIFLLHHVLGWWPSGSPIDGRPDRPTRARRVVVFFAVWLGLCLLGGAVTWAVLALPVTR